MNAKIFRIYPTATSTSHIASVLVGLDLDTEQDPLVLARRNAWVGQQMDGTAWAKEVEEL